MAPRPIAIQARQAALGEIAPRFIIMDAADLAGQGFGRRDYSQTQTGQNQPKIPKRHDYR
ncbi:MAG: hypothetical protein IPL59_13730 [Candidatus Competibacteraceae bacterium]|uniref:hypothetical protein n=1 Tax=Candidatus Contendibacter odensensis TaxID=1400860 RepID=UPI0004B4F4BC|nr:hypothetical protein [Candidatus Contendobacter odensis]MBK8536089.1 hypothetical protein [Candidatus Competibacteraceae bacterium]MBK8752258.1 hypothetical protein [Candidatus Competibacteraceae bacterium]